MNGRLRAPGPALVISLLALFVALGGTSLAAVNLINGRQIEPHSLPKNRLTQAAIKTLHGARGPKGARGVQGLKGDQGDPGPTAASYAYGYLNAGPYSSYTTLLSLAGGSDQYGPGKITVDFAARVLAEANITMYGYTASTVPGDCYLNLIDSSGNATQMSQLVEFTQPAPGPPVGYTDVHVTGARDVPAGTYDVALICKADGSKTGQSFLNVVAAAQ